MEPGNFISLNWINPLLKKLLKIKKKRTEAIGQIINTFGDPLLFLKYYVEPHCQHSNPADSSEDEPIATPRGSAFRLINNFLATEFINRDGSNQMFILADGGMGKTSLLIFMKVSHLTSFWPKRYNCELIKLDESTLRKIKSIPNTGNTILLLDALDEDPTSRNRVEQRIFELLSHTKQFFRVIITCRTKYVSNHYFDTYRETGKIAIGPYQCPTVYLSLLDDTQVIEYLTKRYPFTLVNKLLKIDNKKIQHAKTVVTKMRSLKMRPLLLSFIDEFSGIDITDLNEFKVYEFLVIKWINREIIKLHSMDKNYSIEPTRMLQACISLACFMHINDRRTVKDEEIDLLKNKIREIMHLKDLDLAGRSLLNRTADGSYRFAHYSIQEFLVARGIQNNYLANRKRPVRTTDLIKFFLFQMPLSGIKLSQVDLSRHTFNKGDFSGLDFSGSKVDSATFKECDLSYTSFSRSHLKNCSFHGCTMTQSQFEETSIDSMKVSNSLFTSASFFRSISRGLTITNCELINSDFSQAQLSILNMSECTLKHTRFDKATISLSEITSSTYTRGTFDNCQTVDSDIKPSKDDPFFFNWRT